MNCPFCDSKGMAQQLADKKAKENNIIAPEGVKGAILQSVMDEGKKGELTVLMFDCCPSCNILFLSDKITVKTSGILVPKAIPQSMQTTQPNMGSLDNLNLEKMLKLQGRG